MTKTARITKSTAVPALLSFLNGPDRVMVYVNGHLHAIAEKTAETWVLTAGVGVLASRSLSWDNHRAMVDFFRRYAYCIDRDASDATIAMMMG